MKLISYSESKKINKTGALSNTLGKLGDSLLRKEPKPETIVINTLGKILDNTYFMLSNTQLEELEVLIPLILIGPGGIWVIYPSAIKGIFRAEESNWEAMSERGRGYRPGKPNLPIIADSMAKAVEKFLAERQFNIPTIEPVLVFTHPGVHVETTQPLVRIILSDGLSRFAIGLMQGNDVLNPKEIQQIVNALQGVVPQEQPVEIRDVYTFHEEAPPRKPVRLPQVPEAAREEPEIIKKVSERAPFTKRQWLLLTLLLVVNIAIIIILVLVVLSSS